MSFPTTPTLDPFKYSPETSSPPSSSSFSSSPSGSDSEEELVANRSNRAACSLLFSASSSSSSQGVRVKRERIGAPHDSSPRSPTIARTHSSNSVSQDVFKTAYYAAEQGKVKHNDQSYTVTPLENGRGDFMQVFRIAGRPQMLLKTFNSEIIDENFQSRQQYVRNAMDQHRIAFSLELPVSRIFNKPEIDGFYLVEYVPVEVNCLQWSRGSFESLSEDAKSILSQAKIFFNAFLTHSLPLDLMPRNLRYERDREGAIILKLIDFREIRVPDAELASELKQALTAWSSNNPLIMAYLRADFAMLNPELTSQLDSLFAQDEIRKKRALLEAASSVLPLPTIYTTENSSLPTATTSEDTPPTSTTERIAPLPTPTPVQRKAPPPTPRKTSMPSSRPSVAGNPFRNLFSRE